MRARVADQTDNCRVCRTADLADLLQLGDVAVRKRGPRPRDVRDGDARARALQRLAERHPMEFLQLLGEEEDRHS